MKRHDAVPPANAGREIESGVCDSQFFPRGNASRARRFASSEQCGTAACDSAIRGTLDDPGRICAGRLLDGRRRARMAFVGDEARPPKVSVPVLERRFHAPALQGCWL